MQKETAVFQFSNQLKWSTENLLIRLRYCFLV